MLSPFRLPLNRKLFSVAGTIGRPFNLFPRSLAADALMFIMGLIFSYGTSVLLGKNKSSGSAPSFMGSFPSSGFLLFPESEEKCLPLSFFL